MSLHKLAAQIADKGRYGDTELVHMNRSEIETLEKLLGPLTRNPHTGQLEAFSWKKLLAGIALGALAIPTGGMSLLGALGTAIGPTAAGLLGAAAPIVGGIGAGMAAGAFKPGEKKATANDSEARKYIDAKNEEARKKMEERGIPIIGLRSLDVKPQIDLLGREQQHFQQPGVQPMTGGGIKSLMGYAQGGMLEPEEQKRNAIHAAAISALRGEHDDPSAAFTEFLKTYGPDALQQMAEGGMVEDSGPGGMVEGPGDGMDDMVTGTLNGDQKILVSNDEFVIPADVVSGLGNGSSEGGARFLHSLMDRVRQSRTGTTQQPQKINPEDMIHG